MDDTVEIYADVLFFINMIMDFLCLFITRAVISRPSGLPRLLAAAACGGLYSCAALTFSFLPQAVQIPIHLTAAVIICLIAFGTQKLTSCWLCFTASSALLGGLLCGVYALAGKDFYAGGGFYADVSPFPLIVAAVLLTAIAFLYMVSGKRARSIEARRFVFCYNGRSYTARLMVDSGCSVRDFATGDCVVIISSSLLRPEINCTGADETTLRALGKTARLIPVSTVSGGRLLAAFRPEKAVISKHGKNTPVRVTVAIDCAANAFGGFDGLIPAEIA